MAGLVSAGIGLFLVGQVEPDIGLSVTSARSGYGLVILVAAGALLLARTATRHA